jgi:hypothetical protein
MMLAEHAASATLGNMQRLPDVIDARPATRRA